MDIVAKYINKRSEIFKTVNVHIVVFSNVNTNVSKEHTASILRVETFGSMVSQPRIKQSENFTKLCVYLQITLTYLHKLRPHTFLPKVFTFLINKNTIHN